MYQTDLEKYKNRPISYRPSLEERDRIPKPIKKNHQSVSIFIIILFIMLIVALCR